MNLFQKMLDELPFSPDELSDLVNTAQYRYKVYKIPKRQSGQFRTIAQPSPEIKLIQRWLINTVLSKLPIHKAATAYRKNISIANHAEAHAQKRFLLKMDFKDYFPSISAIDVRKYLTEIGKFSVENARLISLLVCWRDKEKNRLCLSIGAPSSPFLSNAILFTFDKQINELLKGRKIIYTRYADDLAFSTNKKEHLFDVADLVKGLCVDLEYPKLKVNDDKTILVSRAFKRVLVGLTLTPEGKVSLGREKKRRLRCELYRYSLGSVDSELIPKLRGELAFAWSVEKSFIDSLLKQFGVDLFRKLELPFSILEQ